MSGLSVLLGILVQGALRGCVALAAVGVLCRSLRRLEPATLHALWLCAILAFPLCAALPILPFSSLRPHLPCGAPS